MEERNVGRHGRTGSQLFRHLQLFTERLNLLNNCVKQY